MLVAGLEKAGTLVPGTSYIEVDVITNLDAYKRDGTTEPKYILIHPDDIASVREYDLSNRPINMPYHEYQNVISGINPVYLLEMIDEIKDGKQYIVLHQGARYKIVIENEDELNLELLP